MDVGIGIGGRMLPLFYEPIHNGISKERTNFLAAIRLSTATPVLARNKENIFTRCR